MSDKSAVDELKALDSTQSRPQTKADQERDDAASSYQKGENQALSMMVKVHSPFRNYYDGMAFSLTAVNATGPFDILPHHHNFVCLLLPCELIIRSVNDGEQKISIGGGLIHVKADEVIIFLDI